MADLTGAVVAGLVVGQALVLAQEAPQRARPITASEVPQKKKVAALPPRGTYVPRKTAWGDPDIAGSYNNSDESGIRSSAPRNSPVGDWRTWPRRSWRAW